MERPPMTDEECIAADWLMRLRQLRADGVPFDQALATANAEYPEG